MALSSRPYAPRSYSSGSLPPGVKWLLITNSAMYVLYFSLMAAGAGHLLNWAGLVPAQTVGGLRIWQPVTYLFLHSAASFWHILLNMLTLYMFGADLERQWGTREFLRYYFLCGIGAGVTVVVASFLFGNPTAMTIGASGAIYGLLMAFGMLYPDRQILFSFLFPIPAKYFVLILGAIAFLSTVGTSGGGGVSHVAHLGGLVCGYFYLRSRRRRAGFRGRAWDAPGWLSRQYKEWRLRRAKRKFEVYLREHRSAKRDEP